MGKQLNQRLSFWKVVLTELGRTEVLWKGSPLSLRDKRTYVHAIVAWGMLLDDLDLLCDVDDSDLRLWAIDIVQIDVADLARTLSDLITVIRTLSKGEGNLDENWAPFQVEPAATICRPIQGLILEFLDHRSASTFSPVLQFLSFPTRLTLLDIDNQVDLELEYQRIEEEVSHHSIPEYLISDMNRVMRRWLRDFRVERFDPSHGKGAIAELEGVRGVWNPEKDRCLGSDQFLRVSLRFASGFDILDWIPEDRRDEGFERISKVVFVPKSLLTRRVISKEPATLMYFEKAIQREIYRYVSQHPYLARKIDFHDQSLQRDKVLEASRTRSHATIDLSSASDRLSYDLVKKVFRGTPLLPYLMALRSRYSVLPSGKVVELAKYAPMGSALTFPIQTLIFACLAECTSGYVYATTGIRDTDYRVFGDDIIVPQSLFQDMCANLRFAGLVINESKTWAGPYAFRESCGCDAYDGIDVTPLRISRGYRAEGKITSQSPSNFTSLCDFVNSANSYKFRVLRAWLLRQVLETRFPPLFSEDANAGIYSPQPTNYHLRSRWSVDYQREEVRHGSVISRLVAGTPSAERDFQDEVRGSTGSGRLYDDHQLYWVWLCGTRYRTRHTFYPDDVFVVDDVAGNPVTTLRNCWSAMPSTGRNPLPEVQG